MTRYPMDNFCIDRKYLLDRPGVRTLQHPEKHSIHCLVDVPWCYNSLYALLKPPTTPGGDYSVLYQLGEEGTTLVLNAAQQARSTQHADFQVTLTGYDDGNGSLHCVNIVNQQLTTKGAPPTTTPFPAATTTEDNGEPCATKCTEVYQGRRRGLRPTVPSIRPPERQARQTKKGPQRVKTAAEAGEVGETEEGGGAIDEHYTASVPTCSANQYLWTLPPTATTAMLRVTGTIDANTDVAFAIANTDAFEKSYHAHLKESDALKPVAASIQSLITTVKQARRVHRAGSILSTVITFSTSVGALTVANVLRAMVSADVSFAYDGKRYAVTFMAEGTGTGPRIDDTLDGPNARAEDGVGANADVLGAGSEQADYTVAVLCIILALVLALGLPLAVYFVKVAPRPRKNMAIVPKIRLPITAHYHPAAEGLENPATRLAFAAREAATARATTAAAHAAMATTRAAMVAMPQALPPLDLRDNHYGTGERQAMRPMEEHCLSV